jgi:hypothetical protein
LIAESIKAIFTGLRQLTLVSRSLRIGFGDTSSTFKDSIIPWRRGTWVPAITFFPLTKIRALVNENDLSTFPLTISFLIRFGGDVEFSSDWRYILEAFHVGSPG